MCVCLVCGSIWDLGVHTESFSDFNSACFSKEATGDTCRRVCFDQGAFSSAYRKHKVRRACALTYPGWQSIDMAFLIQIFASEIVIGI